MGAAFGIRLARTTVFTGTISVVMYMYDNDRELLDKHGSFFDEYQDASLSRGIRNTISSFAEMEARHNSCYSHRTATFF